ncbi:glycosyltransferase [Corynebacterium alimapuense]|uniref:Glycosyltransferase n=1 Tax=Corynebacterium alimapuense TaxID=1576874 RepID=A0A3M8K7F3_9CORY|nr:glycosyltransferase [Corynebacterium alimapuense]RNE49070.1 glycosyltransferase [Corynebacterium alimapuense]
MWIGYVLGQAVSFFFTLFRMVPLAWNNRLSGAQIPATGEVVISVTSHGYRLNRVHFALESIARGTVKAPIILWLDSADFERELSRPLQRLVARGLQVRCSDGSYGPHTKYWNQFREVAGSGIQVATVDDDMIYPEWFLERLLFINDLRDDVIVAYRAHRIELRGEHILPYVKWSAADTSRASYLHFATGVSGVLYPSTFISYVVEQGDEFMKLTPRADDVWLHACALRSGFPVRQVYSNPRHFAVVPTTQRASLVIGNTLMGGNDEQISRVYRAEDVAMLVAAAQLED